MAKSNKKANKKASLVVDSIGHVEVEQVEEEQAPVTKVKKDKKAKKADKASQGANALAVPETEKPKLSQAAIAKRIISKLENEAKTSIEIGQLLEEAKFYFLKGKRVDGVAHIQWALENFGFNKTQTHRYIAIGRVFGSMEGFDNVPMSVLAKMTSENSKPLLNAAQQAIKDNADDANFTIDSVWLRKYEEEQATIAKEVLETEELTLQEELDLYNLDQVRELFTQVTGEDAGKKKVETLRKAIDAKTDEEVETAIFDIEKAKQAEANKNATVKLEKFNKVSEALAIKEAEVAAMKAELAEKDAAINQGGGDNGEVLNARDKALHKYMKDLPAHLVLGVAVDASKRDANKAKRALEAIYSPVHAHGCESIWLLVVEAAETMGK
jgi:hypothetical protein